MEVKVAVAVNPNVGFGHHDPVLWDSHWSSSGRCSISGCVLVTYFVLLNSCCMLVGQCHAHVRHTLFKACFRQVALPWCKVEDRDDRLCRQQVLVEFPGEGVVENGLHIRIFLLWLLGKGAIIVILFSSRSIAESKDLSFQGGKFFPSKRFSYIWAPQKSLGGWNLIFESLSCRELTCHHLKKSAVWEGMAVSSLPRG